MKELFAILGAGIILFCTLPYIIDVVKRKTRPNIVTWVVWTVLISIGAAALFASHDYNAAWLLVGDAIATFAVVIVGLKYGTAELDGFDIVCLIGALVGLALWLIFDSPIIAIVATIIIDLIGTIPTIRHSYRRPEEETSITFALGAIATIFTLLSLSEYAFSAWIYPAYLLCSNGLLFLIIYFGQHRKRRTS
ncbi:MAG: hypothetical protein JWO99_12 [Candidatus Saccharibacteria bacterium]|nr:hypothetical protein [Candidatus Saccharibacteria bacterium]